MLGIFVGSGTEPQGHGRRAARARGPPVLMRMFREVGPDLDISLTTNGVLLDRLAPWRTRASMCDVSCDSLLRHRFLEMTRRDALDKVLAGMRAAEAAGLTPIKVNCVVIGGTNDDELVEFAGWARDTGYEVRFIEYMPLDAQHAWEREKVVPAARILDAIDDVYPLAAGGHENEPATLPFRRRRAGSHRRDPVGVRALLRHVQPPPTHGRGDVPQLPVRPRRDGPPGAAPRGRVGRGARARDPHGPVDEVVRAPDQPSRLRAAGALDVDDRRLTEPLRGSANPHPHRHPAFTSTWKPDVRREVAPLSGAEPARRARLPATLQRNRTTVTRDASRRRARDRQRATLRAAHLAEPGPPEHRLHDPHPVGADLDEEPPIGRQPVRRFARSACQSEAVDAPIRQRVDRLPLPDLLGRSLSSRTGT